MNFSSKTCKYNEIGYLDKGSSKYFISCTNCVYVYSIELAAPRSVELGYCCIFTYPTLSKTAGRSYFELKVA